MTEKEEFNFEVICFVFLKVSLDGRKGKRAQHVR
jgi:hypothetical protein